MDNTIIRNMIRQELKEFNPDIMPSNQFTEPDDDRTSRYLFTVTADKEGTERLKALAASVKGIFKLQYRGRHDDRREVLGDKYRSGQQNEVPIKDAQYIAVYADPIK